MNNPYFLILVLIAHMALAAPVIAQNNNGKDPIPKEEAANAQINEQKEKDEESISWHHPLTVMELGLLLSVFIFMPIYSYRVSKYPANKDETEQSSLPKLKGLNLPAGSVRSMIALLVVGSFVNFLIFGDPVLGKHFDKILAAFGTLSGSVIGFYFGNRSAEPNLSAEPQNRSDHLQEQPIPPDKDSTSQAGRNKPEQAAADDKQ